MSTDVVFAKRAQDEDWLPILQLAIQEVFEIMLGCKTEATAQSEHSLKGGFTAVVGLAGALCGVITVCCSSETAGDLAKGMLGDAATSESEVVDALGEICNMIAGNFKNKLAGTDEKCMLSVPSVVSGVAYKFHSLADGSSLELTVLYEGAPVVTRLQLQK